MDPDISKEIKNSNNEIKLNSKKTSLKKTAFIMEIQNGLGAEIKENPNRVEIIKKPKISTISNFFSKLFKIF